MQYATSLLPLVAMGQPPTAQFAHPGWETPCRPPGSRACHGSTGISLCSPLGWEGSLWSHGMQKTLMCRNCQTLLPDSQQQGSCPRWKKDTFTVRAAAAPSVGTVRTRSPQVGTVRTWSPQMPA